MYFERGSRVSSRRIVLFLADVLIVVGSLLLSAMLRLSPALGWAYILEHIPTMGGSALVFLLIFYAGGMYERQVITRKGWSMRLPLIVVSLGLTIIIIIFYARFRLHLGRGILVLAGVFIFLGTWLVRRLLRFALGYGLFSKNALIVGEGRDAEAVIRLLKDTDDSGYKLYGVVSCNERCRDGFLEGVPILGYVSELKEFAKAYDVETLIVATSRAREMSLLRLLRPLRYAGIEILDYVGLHEELAQEIPIDHIDDEWLMNAAMNSSRIHIRQMKRVLDILVALFGLIILSPVCIVTAILVRITSHGSALFCQRRVGLDGLDYTLLKFRTMRHAAEKDSGPVWSTANDQRVTGIGRFLRKWRIDEIPQLVNVLRGEMSLVGPRPERPEFIETLAASIPFYKERLLVPPGITGWAQVKFPYAASIEAAGRKVQYDLYYIKNMSLFLDILILLRTFKTIIVGLRHCDEEYLAEEADLET